MNNTPTAEDFAWSQEQDFISILAEANYQEVYNLMIEFAKLHVQAALISAWEKAKIKQEIFSETGEPIYEIDHLSILQSYPSSNIK